MPSITPKRRCKHFANLYVVDSSGVPYSEKSMLLAYFPLGALVVHVLHDLEREREWPSASVWLWPVMYLHALIQTRVSQRNGGIAAVEQLVDGLALVADEPMRHTATKWAPHRRECPSGGCGGT